MTATTDKLSEPVRRLLAEHVARAKKGNDQYLRYEAFKGRLWLTVNDDAEYEAGIREYARLTGL